MQVFNSQSNFLTNSVIQKQRLKRDPPAAVQGCRLSYKQCNSKAKAKEGPSFRLPAALQASSSLLQRVLCLDLSTTCPLGCRPPLHYYSTTSTVFGFEHNLPTWLQSAGLQVSSALLQYREQDLRTTCPLRCRLQATGLQASSSLLQYSEYCVWI